MASDASRLEASAAVTLLIEPSSPLSPRAAAITCLAHHGLRPRRQGEYEAGTRRPQRRVALARAVECQQRQQRNERGDRVRREQLK